MAKGYGSSSDILTATRDGQDLNKIWNDYQDAIRAFNANRQPLIDLLTFSVTNIIEDIVAPGTERFEKASEYGIPKSIRPMPTPTQRAFPFEWWDLRAGYTFQFLAGNGNTQGASAAQLDTILTQAMEADNALLFEQTMKALFNSANRTTQINNAPAPYTVTALYNADSTFIPNYNGVVFPGSHTHYLGSGAVLLDSSDLDQLSNLVIEHGYSRQNGYSIMILVNQTEGDVIKTFRRGVANNNAQTAVYDFIPSTGVGFMLPVGWDMAVGSQPANRFAGMDVIGAYGPYTIVQNNNIPSGYMVAAASAGGSSTLNLIGIREHSNASLQGLVQKPGNSANYPLIDSFFIRGMGAAVSQRGAAAVMQVVNSATYTVPASMVW